ncbi:DNA-3-methylpurine glycosylase [Psychromonas ingrahamii 37]|uniref:DNA-3-methylpurine glycosylase n=1 Tax=Psychromonas ingrahamii (strain DSM 17664 / CCUG 51855 / 37) TaxID=357804 RepID=A1SUJ7_PSYIN|nr:DNA alkylation repair protein [Psychromonas ingrahamii]ABM03162.1 DNA-3-methylpurine glycosylase [Psychromonas ingrahamii 37]
MAEPLKDVYNKVFILDLADQVLSVYPDFCCTAFQDVIFDAEWDDKALKARIRTITNALHRFLPAPFEQSIVILEKIAHRFSGLEALFFPDFVEKYGLDHYQSSLQALEYFTRYSSAEFAVRPFILKYPEAMMAQMFIWSQSDNEHVRRLASEGCRPRLPWAFALSEFKQDPQPLFIILEQLKDDPSEYVRRSVANNLNDISKDHPAVVIKVAQRWLQQADNNDLDNNNNLGNNRQRLVKHACRGLLKQANPIILSLFGFHRPENIKIIAFKVDDVVMMGDKLLFSFTLSSQAALGKLRVEFAIDFMKKNGSLAGKIFQISESTITKNCKQISKQFDFKKISTRQYYPGLHHLSVIVNGRLLSKKVFFLQ